MKLLTVLSISVALCAAQACRADDDKFFKEAAMGGMAEVTLGRLAAQKAENPDVKKFAERMVTDHTKANQELMTIAEKKGWTAPKELSQDMQQHLQHLQGLKGAEFDKAYMQHMVKDHEEDVAAFQKQAENGKDEALKNFASKTLPTLKEHKQMAMQTATKVGVNVNSGNK